MIIQPGSVLKGQYRIDALIGGGGMAMVYRAFDLNLRRVCAIKQNLDTSPQAQRQFHTEAVLLANLNHPHLARVTDHFLDTTGQQYLVMDFVEGENLEDFVARHGPLPEAQALSWMQGVLDAVAYCHSRGVIHRDIKPANLIKRRGRDEVVLVDFGIARQQATGMVTAPGARAATPAYAPPEQFSGHTDARSDVYSLGATLYFLLTDQAPPDARLMAAGIESLVPPRRYNRQISSKTEQAILQAMAVRVPDRPQSVAELQALLTAARPAVQPGSRQRRLALLAGLPILVVALTIVGLLLSGVVGIGTPTPAPSGGAPAVAARPTGVTKTSTSTAAMTAMAPMAKPSLPAMAMPALTTTATPARQPTPTMQPTPSPRPTSTPVPTPTRPAGPAPLPTASLLPAPRLMLPNDGDSPSGQVVFVWAFDQSLTSGQVFRVFLRTEQGGQTERDWHFDAGQNKTLALAYDQSPNVFRIVGAEYFWKVAVVRQSNGQQLSQFSEERRFVFVRSQVSALEPTATPTTASLLPAPHLILPNDGDAPTDQVVFVWSYDRNLTPSQVFRLFLRTEQRGQPEREWTFDTSGTSLALVYDQMPNVFSIPGTEYFWKTAVVQQSNSQPMSHSSEERRFVFTRDDEDGLGDSAPTPEPEPTPTPTP